MDLTCQVCSESYTGSGIRCQRVLPCGHSLCGVCSTRLFVNGQIMCPVCKQCCKYQDLDNISMNHELENVTERLASRSSSINSSSSMDSTPSPKLHYGRCEEHGSYKVHHCLTHSIFICSDCAVAYHLDGGCRRVPIGQYLADRKTDLCMDLDSHSSTLQETNTQLETHTTVFKDSEIHIKSQIDKLQSTIVALKQQMSVCQNSATQYTGLIHECQQRQRQTQISKNKVQNITTFMELNDETQSVESSRSKMQNWNEQVKHMLKEGFGSTLASGTFASLTSSRVTFATYTHNFQQRWGRILSREGKLLLQDLRTDKPPTGDIVINLKDVTEHLSSPVYVYMSFSTLVPASPLGTVVIRLNEQAPMHQQQFIDLFLGKTGARYSGTTAIRMYDTGKPNERLIFEYYLNTNNENSKKKLCAYLEKTGRVPHKQGSVVIQDEDCAGFRILTGKGYTGTWPGPAIGQVVSGMPMLEKMIGDNLVLERVDRKSPVIISETGLVIDSNVRNN